MAGDGVGVAARDGTGERALSTLQCVLQGRPGQRGDHPFGEAPWCVTDQFLPEELLTRQREAQRFDGVEQHGDHVVARMRQGRVIERTRILTDAERLAADLEHQ